MAQANLKAVVTAEDRASSVLSGVGTSFGKLTAAFAAGQLAAQAVSKALQVVTDTVKSSVGAAFSQVRSVENATIALRAYEKNGDAVNKVLKDLIGYARSDLGVLFQREDLFAAAQTLKLYGQSTDTLTEKVKILSKGVSLGKTTFQELSSIVGRAAAKGRLDAVDFDMLIERGIGLDKKFRGAKVSADQLFKALNNALPDELLKGRANTIDGAFIRLKSGLRDFGATILGINKDTTTFIEGGLGDRFIKAIRRFTDFLKSPEFTNTVKLAVDKLFEFGRKALEISQKIANFLEPKVIALKNTLIDFMPTAERLWREVLKPLAEVFGTVLVVRIGLAIDAINLLFTVLQPVINWMLDNKWVVLALAGAFTYLGVVMNFSNIVSAFTGAMDLVIGKLAATQATASNLATFLTGTGAASFGIIAAAAVVAGILIVDAGNKAKAAWDNAQKSIDAASKSDDAVISRLRDLAKNGNAEQQARAKSQLQKLAATGAFASGGFTGRGMTNDIAGVVHKGEYVIPKSGVDQNTGMPKIKLNDRQPANINITVQAGAYMGNKQDARKYAEAILQAMKDTAKMNGTTVGSMLGA